MIRRIGLLFTLVLVLTGPHAVASDWWLFLRSCLHLIALHRTQNVSAPAPLTLTEVLHRHWEDPRVYIRDRCFDNAGELFRRFAAAPHPGIALEEVKILLVMKRSLDISREQRDQSEESVIQMVAARGGPRLTTQHAFLYYEGIVWDLDHQVLPMSFGEYLAAMFPQQTIEVVRRSDNQRRRLTVNIPRELGVRVISARDYLRGFRWGRPGLQHPGDQRRLRNLWRAVPLLSLDEFTQLWVPLPAERVSPASGEAD